MPVVGVVAAIALIIVLSIKKVALSKVMFLSTLVMALSSGLSFTQSVTTIWNAFISPSTINLVLSVIAIGLFSTIMNETGYLDKMVQGLHGFLGNLKASIMVVPALIGSMPVLGGAAVSAPLVDKLGEELHLTPDKKAAVNLVFRHGMFFIFPFSPNLILLANMIGVQVNTLLSRLWPFGIVLWLTGYMFLLRKESSLGNQISSEQPGTLRGESFLVFLKYGSPLLVALGLSLFLDLPLWAAMLTGLVLGIVMAHFEKVDIPSLTTILRGANLSQAVAMLWIMAFKEFVTMSPVFPTLVEHANSLGISPPVLAVVLPLLFGYVSASLTTTLGVLVPILIPAEAHSSAVLYLACIIYAAGFLAYFASPLHLCQVLTCEYYKIDFSQLYKLYWPILLAVGIVMLAYAGIAATLL